MEARAREVEPEPVGIPDAVAADLHLVLEVEDHAGRRLAAPEAQVEYLGQAGRRRGGQGGFLHRDTPARLGLDLGGAGGARERVEVFAGGGADPRAVRALAGDLEGGVQGLLAQPAARVLRDERSIGLDRVFFVARRLEALRHQPVHVADGEQRVVAVPALRIACEHPAEAQYDALPFRTLRLLARRRLQRGQAVGGLAIERPVGRGVGCGRGPGARGGLLRVRAGGGRDRRRNRRCRHRERDGRGEKDAGGHLGQ